MRTPDFTLLERLISIPSVFPNEKKIGDFLFNFLEGIGFSVERQRLEGYEPQRNNILASKGSGNSSILFYAHMDTVPPYGIWSNNPFEMVERNGLLYGLGVNDMKGGLFAILEAVRDFEPKGFMLKIAFGVDEEDASRGAFLLSESDFIKDVRMIIVPEVGTSREMDNTKSIILGRRGRALYEITVPGLSCHGSISDTGINAIDEAIRLIPYLMNISLCKHPKLGSENIFIKSFKSDTASLSVPDSATLVLDMHLVTPDTPEKGLDQLQGLIDYLYEEHIFEPIDGKRIEARFYPRDTPYLSPYLCNEDDKLVKQFIESSKRVFNNLPIRYGLSVADENVFADMLDIPVIVSGPIGGDEHHQDEWVLRKSLIDLAQSFKIFLDDLNTLKYF